MYNPIYSYNMKVTSVYRDFTIKIYIYTFIDKSVNLVYGIFFLVSQKNP